MTEERTLVANVVPNIAEDDLRGVMDELAENLSSTLDMTINADGGDSDTYDLVYNINENFQTQLVEMNQNLSGIRDILQDVFNSMSDVNNILTNQDETASNVSDVTALASEGEGGEEGEGESESAETSTEKAEKKSFFSQIKEKMGGVFDKLGGVGDLIKGIPEAMKDGPVGIIMAGVNFIMNFVKKLWDKLLASSPFLRNIITMFDQVLNLILGPIGTAIGIELIPMLKNLYNSVYKVVQAMWKAYEEDGLSGMIREAIRGILPILKEFLPDLAMTLIEVIPEIVAGVAEGVFSFFKGSSGNGIIDAFKNLLGSTLGGGFLFADGGVVEPTPNGTLAVIGEGGEREFVFPQSKLEQYTSNVAKSVSSNRGGDTYYISVTGYTDTDLTDKIVTVLNRKTDAQRIYGGLRCRD